MEKNFTIKKELKQRYSKDEINQHYITNGLNSILGIELEITLPVCEGVANNLLQQIGNELLKNKSLAKDGIELELSSSNKKVPLKLMLLKMKDAMNSKNDVLRLVFADTKGKFPGEEGCNRLYDNQV